MKVIKPVQFQPSMLKASNVPEDDYAAYDPLVTYAVGARVVFDHAIYESAQGSNTGNQPDAEPLWWTYISATNRYLMFDSEVNTQTIVNSPLQVMVAPGLVNSLALLELQGTEIIITGRDGNAGPVIYEHSQNLEGSIINDWYEYFFEPFSPMTELVLTDVPAYGGIHLEVEINSGLVVAPVAVGAMVFGTAYDLGKAERGARAGILDYSRKETSATGTTRFQQRRFSRRASLRLVVDNLALNKVHRLLSELRATPCVWIGTEDPQYGFLTLFGFYRDFSIDIAYAHTSYCSLEVEGLV